MLQGGRALRRGVDRDRGAAAVRAGAPADLMVLVVDAHLTSSGRDGRALRPLCAVVALVALRALCAVVALGALCALCAVVALVALQALRAGVALRADVAHGARGGDVAQ